MADLIWFCTACKRHSNRHSGLHNLKCDEEGCRFIKGPMPTLQEKLAAAKNNRARASIMMQDKVRQKREAQANKRRRVT